MADGDELNEPASPDNKPNTPAPIQAPPAAATVVVEGTKSERELKLEADLKAREMRMAELEDENGRLKRIGVKPEPKPTDNPAPAPAPKKDQWTYFDED